MQKLMGLVRRCVDDYHMISAGDRIAVGVSGGKDSLVLLVLLAGLKAYFNKPFELEAITIDMGLGMDYSPIAKLCEELNVPYTIEEDGNCTHHLRSPEGEESLLHVCENAPGCPESGNPGPGLQ